MKTFEGKYANSITYKIDAKEKDYLYVQDSQIKGGGKGLYTAIPIYRNEIICVFKGEYLSPDEARKRSLAGQDRYFISMLHGGIMDSMHVNCFAKFANDAVDSLFRTNSRISLDEMDQVCIVASRNIKAHEEIFCSYGKQYWKKHRQADPLFIKNYKNN
jgi:hypothetical protein